MEEKPKVGENPGNLKEKDDRPIEGELDEEAKMEMREIMKRRLSEISEGKPAFESGPYVGKKTTIENVIIEDGQYGEMIKAETEQIGIFEKDDGTKQPIRASVIFSVYTEGEGDKREVKFRPKGKLAVFMEKHKLESVADIIGCEVLVTLKSTVKGDFLSFV